MCWRKLFQGIFSPSLASDCVGGLLRELKMHCTAGKFHLLVAIDNANSLYGKTLVKGADNKYVDPADLTLVHHLRKLFRKDWVQTPLKLQLHDFRAQFVFRKCSLGLKFRYTVQFFQRLLYIFKTVCNRPTRWKVVAVRSEGGKTAVGPDQIHQYVIIPLIGHLMTCIFLIFFLLACQGKRRPKSLRHFNQ